MHRRSVLFFAGLILLQSVLYGFGDPISKAAYETMSVYSLMTVRYAIAVAALLLVCGRRIAQGLRAVSVRLWLVPSLCIAAGYVLNNIALNLTTATSATFLRSMAIILTPILAFLIHRTRYRWVHIPLQLLVVVGLYLFCGGFSGFGVGELVGGSQREERLDRLEARMQELGMNMADYKEYLDLRRFGSVPHAGYGLGFERLIMYLTGIPNIRDVIPYPRTAGGF